MNCLEFVGVRDINMGESAARARALPCLKFYFGAAMAKASREKAVETASYRTTSPLNRPSKDRPNRTQAR